MIIKIFQAGEYPQGNWPIERVRKMVNAYDPTGSIEAPGVVGHMENSLSERIENELAYCWVRTLSMDEAGNVFADIPNEEISTQLRGWLINKNLKYISSEIMPYDELKVKDHKDPYLVRVAFLGRSIPAVPTTKVPSLFNWALTLFSSVPGVTKKPAMEEKLFSWSGRIGESAVSELIDFCANCSTPGPEPEKIDAHSSQAPSGDLADGNTNEGPEGSDDKGDEEPMTKEEQQEFENLKTQNAALQVQNKALSDQVSGFKKDETDRTVKEKLVKLRDAGKITPAQFKSLENEVPKMDEKSRELLFSAYEGADPAVDLGIEHKGTGNKEKKFSGNLVNRIQAFAKEKNLSYAEAATQLYEAEPALFNSEDSASVVV